MIMKMRFAYGDQDINVDDVMYVILIIIGYIHDVIRLLKKTV